MPMPVVDLLEEVEIDFGPELVDSVVDQSGRLYAD